VEADVQANERTISEQQAEAEALFTSIGDGAIATDEFGRITRVNPVALRILGYEENDLIGEWFPKKIVAVDDDGNPVNLIDRPITRAFLTGRTIAEKAIYKLKDGRTIPISLTVSPILLNDTPLGAIEVFRDITLEQEVDRMKSEFISLASHQLRTPLSAIKTYTHMLADGYMGEVNDTQRKSLKTIISATNRMNELISTLLNITRMETGTIAISPKVLEVDKVADEVIKELSLMAADKEVALKLKNVGPATKTVKNIVKRETTGTGLGLYLVKGLLDALGGKIWFKSAEGQGTTFYFTLPKPTVRSKKAGKKPGDADKAENL
jgi:PAS domain S-box-containing protein